MQAQLSHNQARELFFAFADDEIAEGEELKLRDHLTDCVDCRGKWDRYARTVQVVKTIEREKAPAALSSVIMRRARRKGRPSSPKGLQLAYAHYRFPVETIIPVLIGALVAAFLVMLAP